MLGWFVLGLLAACGLMSVMWTLFGFLLPDVKGCVLCRVGDPDERTIWRYKWLRGMGFLTVPLLIITEETGEMCPGAECCTETELIARLEWERKRYDGTGNGDHSGRSQCRDLSEL